MNSRRLNVGVIGKNNQAGRLIDLIRRTPGARLVAVYYPFESEASTLPLTGDFSRLLACDAVVIASPTPTHAAYLKRLTKFPGYVLVEKPAASSLRQGRALLTLPSSRKRRIKVNFNFLHSDLFQHFATTCRDRRLGKLISLDIHTSHGLAFKDSYRKSWRTQSGVLETVGVHYVNAILKLFGPVRDIFPRFSWIASRRGAPDTASLSLTTGDGLQVNLRHSYAAPALNQWLLVGSDGYWTYDGLNARLFCPRDTFDSNGRFSPPPVVSTKRLPHAEGWNRSLERSVRDFIKAARANKPFSPEEFDLAIRSIEPIALALADARAADLRDASER